MTSSNFPRYVGPSYFGGAACIFLNVSLMLFIIAFASPYWFESGDSYYLGLWQACYKVTEDVKPSNGSTTPAADQWKCSTSQAWITGKGPGFDSAWLVGVEAIQTMSLIFLIPTSVGMILFVGSSPMAKELAQGILFASFCLTFAIACFSLTAVIVCGALVSQEDSAVRGAELSWSFIIATLSTCLNWFCAFALLVEVIRVMAAAPVEPIWGSSSPQHSSTELRQMVASGLNADQNEAVGYENEASTTQNGVYANESEAEVKDGGGHYEKPEVSSSAGTAGNGLYESLGILPSQFTASDIFN